MLKAIAKFLEKPDLGFLIMRIVAGVIFIAAGVSKFMGGSGRLESTGESMAYFGITFAPIVWGILAALVETVGGLLLIVGFLFRGAAVFLTATMIVATVYKVDQNGFDIQAIGYPLIMLAVAAGLMFTGPGKIAAEKGAA